MPSSQSASAWRIDIIIPILSLPWSLEYKRCEESFLFRNPHPTSTIPTMNQQEVILVTGANTGLGYQIIRALCDSTKSYTILLAGRSLLKAQQAVRSATQEFPSSCSKLWPIQVDIEDEDSIQRAFDEVQTNFGRIDALVNNAGTYQIGRSKINQHKLTDHRRTTRPTTRLGADEDAPDVEPVLEHQHRRNANHDISLHAPIARVKQPSPPVHHERHFHPRRNRKPRPGCEQIPSKGMAEIQLRRQFIQHRSIP